MPKGDPAGYLPNVLEKRKKKPLREVLKGREAKHETDKGPRKLSAREAFTRRTTDSSRARALKRYGLTKPPAGLGMDGEPIRKITDPVKMPPGKGFPHKPKSSVPGRLVPLPRGKRDQPRVFLRGGGPQVPEMKRMKRMKRQRFAGR